MGEISPVRMLEGLGDFEPRDTPALKSSQGQSKRV